MRQLSTRLIEFAKTNSGALIIGVSLIIGLNFSRFINYVAEVPYAVHLAIYHLSGQAAADARAQQEYWRQAQEYAQEQAKEREKYQQEQAKRAQEYAQKQAKEKLEKEAQIELTRVLAASWQEFLAANRTTFKQIYLIKDSANGDYSCLDIRQRNEFDSFNKSNDEIKAAEQKAEVSTYPVRDSVADAFLQWLNGNKLSGKIDWKYEDLQNMNSLEFHPHNYSCSIPKDVWRANRYPKRIE